VTAPLLSKLCIAAALLLSIALAFFGPPPRRASATTVRILIVVAVSWYLLAAYAAVADRGALWVAALLAAAVETTCVAAWLVRYRPEPAGEDEEDKEPDRIGPPEDQDPYAPLWAGYREPPGGGSRLWTDP
jgi:hypothetical protein